MTKGIGGHHRAFRGESDEWLTPPPILEALGPFDLDPCCPEKMPWKTANVMLTPRFDGLTAMWHGRVWLNPPYGPSTGKWLLRMVHHGQGTALIFARTETVTWAAYIWAAATAVHFIYGRLHFHHPDGTRAPHNCGGPSALVAYGERDAQLLKASGIPGMFVRLKNP